MVMDNQVYTTFEVARLCRVTLNTVVNWIKNDQLKAYKTPGGHRRIKRSDLLEFLKKNNMPYSLRQRILVVDDDDDIQLGLMKMLSSKGFEVRTAGSGFEAGMIIEDLRPDLVILDLVMPEMDGFAVCKLIRNHLGLEHTKIIVQTGYPTEENMNKAQESGAHTCLAKPVEKKTLLEAVYGLLGGVYEETE